MNGSGANGVISQAFGTTAGQRYNVFFWIAGNPDDVIKSKSILVSAAGHAQSFEFNTTGKTHTNMGWTEESFSFIASGSSSTLTFASTQAPNSNGSVSSWGLALDNVSVTAVPEPGTYALMLAGLGLMGAISRRRKAKQA
jgi:choice-of-anchor C domain-containing protein